MDYNAAFGIAFKRLRALKGKTQEDFASVVSERYVRMLERGEYSPSLTTIIGLSQALEMSPITLLSVVHAEATGSDVDRLMQLAAAEVSALEKL